MKPITPKEVVQKKLESIPDKMIEAINNLIGNNWNGNYSKIKQKDIIKEYHQLVGNNKSIPLAWLDFEDIYRKSGWVVVYNKPERGESFDSHYEFTSKKNA